MPEVLDVDTVDRELSAMDGWNRQGDTLTKTWQRTGFNGAVQLANVVAFLANQANHHPDIAVHGYSNVTVTTTTHDSGGITRNDLNLARAINSVVGE